MGDNQFGERLPQLARASPEGGGNSPYREWAPVPSLAQSVKCV